MLWLHDVDLNQVTARKQAQALGSTPLGLILSATDLSALQAAFQLQTEPARDGLQWVRATPRANEGQIVHALAGLRMGDKGPELAVLEVLDSLGQRSVLTFTAFEANATIRHEVFEFQAPAGADVIRPGPARRARTLSSRRPRARVPEGAPGSAGRHDPVPPAPG